MREMGAGSWGYIFSRVREGGDYILDTPASSSSSSQGDGISRLSHNHFQAPSPKQLLSSRGWEGVWNLPQSSATVGSPRWIEEWEVSGRRQFSGRFSEHARTLVMYTSVSVLAEDQPPAAAPKWDETISTARPIPLCTLQFQKTGLICLTQTLFPYLDALTWQHWLISAPLWAMQSLLKSNPIYCWLHPTSQRIWEALNMFSCPPLNWNTSALTHILTSLTECPFSALS